MADYRELSQQYAQGGIKAVALLNSGAAVAVLAQLSDLPPHMKTATQISMLLWVIGASLGALAWMLAFGSTRYVDKADDEKRPAHIGTANAYQFSAIGCFFAALALFALGAGSLSLAY